MGWVYSQLGTKKRRKQVLGKMKQTWERQGKSDLSSSDMYVSGPASKLWD